MSILNKIFKKILQLIFTLFLHLAFKKNSYPIFPFNICKIPYPIKSPPKLNVIK